MAMSCRYVSSNVPQGRHMLDPLDTDQPEEAVGFHQQHEEQQHVGCHLLYATSNQWVQVARTDVFKDSQEESGQERSR